MIKKTQLNRERLSGIFLKLGNMRVRRSRVITQEHIQNAILECLYKACMESNDFKICSYGGGREETYFPDSGKALKDITYITVYVTNKFSASSAYNIRALLNDLESKKLIGVKSNGSLGFLYKIECEGIRFLEDGGYVHENYIKQLEIKKLEYGVKFWKSPLWWVTICITLFSIYVMWKHK